MSRKFGRILVFLGIVLLIGAAGIIIYNDQLSKTAGIQSKLVLDELRIERISGEMEGLTANKRREVYYSNDVEQEIPDYLLRPTMDMPEDEVNGISYIGVIEIPGLQLSLPVISSTTKANLKIAPCRYTGSAYLDNLVIGAHNYKAHFGNIDDLQYEESVVFKDIDGNEFVYKVANIEVLQPEQVDDLCVSEWALSLYTCTSGGQSRIVVRCERQRE